MVDEDDGLLLVWDSSQLTAIELGTGRRRLVAGPGTLTPSVNAACFTPQGVAVVDYVPLYEPNPTTPTVVLIDPARRHARRHVALTAECLTQR